MARDLFDLSGRRALVTGGGRGLGRGTGGALVEAGAALARVRNAEVHARLPAGRWGEPVDLAGAVVFLASAASDDVHGIVLPADGGWLAR